MNTVLAKICRFVTSKYALASVLIGLAGWALSILLYFSWEMILPENRVRWNDVIKLAENPFRRDLEEPILSYRILIPGIFYLLGLNPQYIMIVPYICGMFTIILLALITRKYFEDETGSYLTISLALSGLLLWTNIVPGAMDTVTHMFSALCLFNIQPFIYTFLVFAGCMNDERMFLAVPFILMWKYCWHKREENSDRYIKLLTINIVLGIILYILFRYMLKVGVIGEGIDTPKVYKGFIVTLSQLQPYTATWRQWLWNVFMSYRWCWLVFFIGLLCGRVNIFLKCIILVVMSGTVFSTILVGDVSRSISYSYPCILVAAVLLQKYNSLILKSVAKIVFVLQIMTPAGFYVVGHLMWLSPPLYKYARMKGWI